MFSRNHLLLQSLMIRDNAKGNYICGSKFRMFTKISITRLLTTFRDTIMQINVLSNKSRVRKVR